MCARGFSGMFLKDWSIPQQSGSLLKCFLFLPFPNTWILPFLLQFKLITSCHRLEEICTGKTTSGFSMFPYIILFQHFWAFWLSFRSSPAGGLYTSHFAVPQQDDAWPMQKYRNYFFFVFHLFWNSLQILASVSEGLLGQSLSLVLKWKLLKWGWLHLT